MVSLNMVIQSGFIFRDEITDRAMMSDACWVLAQYMGLHTPVVRCTEVAVITHNGRDFSRDYRRSDERVYTGNASRSIKINWGLQGLDRDCLSRNKLDGIRGGVEWLVVSMKN